MIATFSVKVFFAACQPTFPVDPCMNSYSPRSVHLAIIITSYQLTLRTFGRSRCVDTFGDNHYFLINLRFLDIRLVVICCRELEDRCHIIKRFGPLPSQTTTDRLMDVQTYLKQHLAVANVAGRTLTAASLDPERSTDFLFYHLS